MGRRAVAVAVLDKKCDVCIVKRKEGGREENRRLLLQHREEICVSSM